MKNNKEKLNNIEFKDVWMSKLSPAKKIVRLEKSALILVKALEFQLTKLEEFDQSDLKRNVGFIYFLETVKTIYDNAILTISLGKGKNRKFGFYPVRTIFENTLQLEYYCGQKKEGQDAIAINEVSRIAKRFYDREQKEPNSGNSQYFKDIYDSVVTHDYPTIDKAKTKDLFPNFEKLTTDSRFNIDGNLYFSYRDLAESTHGKLIARVIVNDNEQGEYIRGMMHLIFLLIQVLKIIDAHIGGATAVEITKAINEAEEIGKASM